MHAQKSHSRRRFVGISSTPLYSTQKKKLGKSSKSQNMTILREAHPEIQAFENYDFGKISKTCFPLHRRRNEPIVTKLEIFHICSKNIQFDENR